MASSCSPADHNTPYHMNIEAAGDETMDVTIAKAVAAARNQDPAASDIQLYDYVEPESLEQLYTHGRNSGNAGWEFTFSVENLDVVIDSEGQIRIS